MSSVCRSDPLDLPGNSGVWQDRGNTPNTPLLHATAVAYLNRGVLILGPSGSGKSALALQLMAYGCDLISDDRVSVALQNPRVTLNRPAMALNQIEARGVGLIPTATIETSELALIVDLSQRNEQRLPEIQFQNLFGCKIRYILGTDAPHFPAAILQMLKSERD